MADREERTYYVKLYVERGYVVIPVRFGDPQDKYWGKIPLGENWQLVTLEECPGNFERANQRQTELNIGIRTGKDSNLIVVDIDLANSGMEYYREVLEPMLRLNNCFPPMIQTGSGGYHLYFGYTPYAARLVNSAKLKTPQGLFGIDVKTNGGYVVAVPSLHKSGNRYSFCRGDISNRPEMPNWLVDFLQPIKVREPVPVRFTPRYRYSEVQIVELLNLLSDYRADSYTEWRDVCFSIGRSLQQSYESLLIMRDFSARSNKCHDRNNEEKIVGFFQASYRDDGYSINHLIELAEEDNPDGLRAWKQRYPIKNPIERALRQDADDVIEEIDTENESVDGSGNESDSESDNNLEVNSTPKTKIQPIQVSKQIKIPNQIIVEPISQPVNQQRLVTLASITNPKSIAKAVVKVRELVELITPVQDMEQVSQIIWAIIKSTNNATGYVDLVHELAIKWLNSEYSVSKIAEIIKLNRRNGKGFGEKFLVGRAKAENQ